MGAECLTERNEPLLYLSISSTPYIPLSIGMFSSGYVFLLVSPNIYNSYGDRQARQTNQAPMFAPPWNDCRLPLWHENTIQLGYFSLQFYGQSGPRYCTRDKPTQAVEQKRALVISFSVVYLFVLLKIMFKDGKVKQLRFPIF